MAKVKSLKTGIQTGTTHTAYASWDLAASVKKKSTGFVVEWQYYVNSLWFVGKTDNITGTAAAKCRSTYSVPDNAAKYRVRVKPVAAVTKTDGKSVPKYTASWSAWNTGYPTTHSMPSTPSTPKISISNNNLIMEVDIYDSNTSGIEFYVVKNDSAVFKTVQAAKTTNKCSTSVNITLNGDKYKVKCRAYNKVSKYSDWSQYSENAYTIPANVGVISLSSYNENTVLLSWGSVVGATSYNIEAATKKEFFGTSSDVKTMSVNAPNTKAYFSGLTSGEIWYFRVAASNSVGQSISWSHGGPITLGVKPASPTIWSLFSTAKIGDPMMLYWVHNSLDGSVDRSSILEFTVNGKASTITVNNSSAESGVRNYSYSTTNLADGTEVIWRVRTKGIHNEYSDWSSSKSFKVYSEPSLTMTLSCGSDIPTLRSDGLYSPDDPILDGVLTSYPLYVTLTGSPNTQKPLTYTVEVVANDDYSISSFDGTTKNINCGDIIYSTNVSQTYKNTYAKLDVGDLLFENGVEYTIQSKVFMDTGLSAEISSDLSVDWEDVTCFPDCLIMKNEKEGVVFIQPLCFDEEDEIATGQMMAIYRINYDDTLTLIANNIPNNETEFVCDPHPSLNYMRYRIAAIDQSTGSINFEDVSSYFGIKSIIIQWDETYNSFATDVEDDFAESQWSGCKIVLPYNIDISNETNIDVALVNYVGRKHPVSYYGTQIGEKSSWRVDILKDDEDTIRMLRKLSKWMGDVYVREPSGVGYWCKIKVSFSINHIEMVIPVTLDIIRVEGEV